MFLEKYRAAIEAEYAALKTRMPERMQELAKQVECQKEHTALALKYLYTAMPVSDLISYPMEVFLEYAEHGVWLWEHVERVRALPEEYFLCYVLQHRVNTEEIRPCRKLFWEQLHLDSPVRKGRAAVIDGSDAVAAALEANFWCAENATYQSTDGRTISAAAMYQRGFGRCGEESTLLVNVLRSIGIPARQVYVPRWSHCDDNHAWVELWCDGKWYFTGACEPLMILNAGWFTNAASRAMLVHARVFGSIVPEDEEVIGREGKTVILNEIARYAACDTIRVCVLDADGHPEEGAEVRFEILNYAEYYPAAAIRTGADGCVSFRTGFGSLGVHVCKDGRYVQTQVDTRTQKVCTVTLPRGLEETESKAERAAESKEGPYEAAAGAEDGWCACDITAPVDTPVHTEAPTMQQKEEGSRRLDEANALRLRLKSGWENPERSLFLQKQDAYSELRRQMDEVISEKDRSDCVAEILEEHVRLSAEFAAKLDQKLFTEYVLNPRIACEVLTPYRSGIRQYFGEEEQKAFVEDPRRLWSWIAREIRECPEEEMDGITAAPYACLRFRMGSRKSKELLFVAVLRTLGLPSRLNPESQAMEYWDGRQFAAVLPAEQTDCTLTLQAGGDTKWQYFQNWSLASLQDGVYQSLDLCGLCWKEGSLTVQLKSGRYRLITANRLPNGNQFVWQKEFDVASGMHRTETLRLRSAALQDLLEKIPLPEFFVHDQEQQVISSRELAAGGKQILLWLEESREPTEHILNEMLELQERFREYADRIVFFTRTPESLQDPTIRKTLEAFPQIRTYFGGTGESGCKAGTFDETVYLLGRRMYVDHEKLPLILVLDEQQNSIYAVSGYNVGTGAMLLRLMKEV